MMKEYLEKKKFDIGDFAVQLRKSERAQWRVFREYYDQDMELEKAKCKTKQILESRE